MKALRVMRTLFEGCVGGRSGRFIFLRVVARLETIGLFPPLRTNRSLQMEATMPAAVVTAQRPE
jgi:hypothetical protein